MKISKSLFLAFAGLGLFACSNEDVTTSNSVEGNAVVSVKLVLGNDILSRAGGVNVGLSNPTTDTQGKTPVVINSLKLKLTAAQGGKEETFTAKDGSTIMQQVEAYEFKGVVSPTKMEVFINGDENAAWTFDAVAETGLAVPMYASTGDFIKSDGGADDGATHYEVTLAPANRFARLEFSGIQHDDESESCTYAAGLNFQGLYLNNIIRSTADATTVTKSSNWTEAQAKTLYTTVGEEFVTNKTWPEAVQSQDKCYGYTIIAGDGKTIPELNLWFTNVEYADAETNNHHWVSPVPNTACVTVAKYKLAEATGADIKSVIDTNSDGFIDTFAAGYVYRFTNMVVKDENLHPGDGEVHVIVAEVTVEDWKTVDGTVEWK